MLFQSTLKVLSVHEFPHSHKKRIFLSVSFDYGFSQVFVRALLLARLVGYVNSEIWQINHIVGPTSAIIAVPKWMMDRTVTFNRLPFL